MASGQTCKKYIFFFLHINRNNDEICDKALYSINWMEDKGGVSQIRRPNSYRGNIYGDKFSLTSF